MRKPRVSVITALRDKGPYIEQTIASVAKQNVTDWEMIVVENGSVDDGPSRVAVMAAADDRIKLFKTIATGPGGARNFGIDHASGRWILFLDADDLLEPNYLQERLSAAGESGNVQVVAGPWSEFVASEDEDRIIKTPAGFRGDRQLLDTAAFAFAPWVLHAALVRRKHLVGARRWKGELDNHPAEDAAFWFPVIYQSEVVWANGAGALYRKHTQDCRSSSRSGRVSFEGCRGTLRCNTKFLSSLREMPSSKQAATVVRMLRRLLSQIDKGDRALVADLQGELTFWLRQTSFLDMKMLFWRLYWGSFRGNPELSKQLSTW